MKRTIVTAILLVLVTTSFSQQNNPKQTLTSKEYLNKSKNQKGMAFILLGGGAVMIGASVLIYNQERYGKSASVGGVLGAVGLVSVISSIPLFIASAHNVRRGMAASAYLKMEDVSAIRGFNMIYTSFPALSIRLRL